MVGRSDLYVVGEVCESKKIKRERGYSMSNNSFTGIYLSIYINFSLPLCGRKRMAASTQVASAGLRRRTARRL